MRAAWTCDRGRQLLPAAAAATVLMLAEMPASAAPPGSGWNLAFADEFSGAAVDGVKWDVASPGWTMPNSASTATASKVAVAAGSLTLTATRTGNNAWSSGSVSTYTKFRFDGGYLESRIQLPSTPGSWPAFWGLYDGWPPEMDVMEYPLSAAPGSGYANDTYHTAFHYTNASNAAAAGAGPVDTNVDMRGTWHTFGANWTSDSSVTFYLDGVAKTSYSAASVSQMANMYMILDYAVGGWPGTPSTAQWAIGASDTTNVDWVRVWQQRPTGATASSAWTKDGGGGWDAAANWAGLVPTLGGQQATFGRTGAAAAANITWTGNRVAGGLIFDADAAYTLAGGTNASLQLVGASGGNAAIRLLAANAADQTINSRVELYATADVSNDSAKSLVLNGAIVGDGGLNLAGPGVVVFSNNNTYAGDTTLEKFTQGAAVARVTRSRAFGTGTVRIGPNGNATTARVEIQDNRSLPNAIVLSGRNNTSAGLVNLSGTNALTGTISAASGGATYLIQSDGGLLTLSGADGGNVALTAIAGGTRTFTLGGAGDGLVSGSVVNGAATLALTKTGNGTWTLSSANTFTGGVTVTAGTVVADGPSALGAGNVSIGSAGTLAVAAGRDVAGLTGLSVANGGTLAFSGAGELSLASGVFALGNVTIDLNNAYDAIGTYTLIDGVAGANAIGNVAFVDASPSLRFALALSGNDSVLSVTALPEPAAMAAVAIGGIAAARRRRRG